jgi:GT2 family glycosyltransferase
VLELQATHPNLELVDNPGRIVATGLNAALARARGQVIVRVDGHTIIARDYVSECVAALERSGADNAGGRMDAMSGNQFGQAVSVATSSPFGVGGARFHYSEREEFVDTVYLGAWRHDVFERIGLFDEELVRNQDDEFNYRLLSCGGKILLSPRIKSEYYNRATLRSLSKQYFQYGYWKVRVMQKHLRQMRLRQFIPPLFAASLLIGALLSPFSAPVRILTLFILVTYLLANLAASLWATPAEHRRILWLVPVAFATIHLSYGSGFLIGLARFWNRWRNNSGPRSSTAARNSEHLECASMAQTSIPRSRRER